MNLSPLQIAVLLPSVLLFGCVGPQALGRANSALDAPHGAGKAPPGAFQLGKLTLIAPEGTAEAAAKALRSRLAATIEAAAPQAAGKAPITLDATYRIGHTTYRTYYLDAVALVYLGLFPLTPSWGSAGVVLSLQGTRDAKTGAALPKPAVLCSRQRYHNLFFSWYQTGALNRAYERAHEGLLAALPSQLAPELHAEPDFGSALAWDTGRHCAFYPSDKRFEFDKGGSLKRVELLRPWQFRIIRDETVYQNDNKPTKTGFWHDYLSALSGVELGYFRGLAEVSSQAQSDSGPFTIASGRATTEGYKINFFSPPTASGFFIYPTAGFFSLNISIADFAGDIPLGRVPGAQDLGAVATNPKDGSPIALGAPNVYQLRLRSGYLGQRLGGTLVYGNPRTQLFLTAEGGVNLLEWRYTAVTLGPYEESKHHLAVAGSVAGRLLVGATFRPWHLALRCELNYEGYREFDYPRPLPFEAPVRYNAQTQAYERPPIHVGAASAHTFNAYCGASLAY